MTKLEKLLISKMHLDVMVVEMKDGKEIIGTVSNYSSNSKKEVGFWEEGDTFHLFSLFDIKNIRFA